MNAGNCDFYERFCGAKNRTVTLSLKKDISRRGAYATAVFYHR